MTVYWVYSKSPLKNWKDRSSVLEGAVVRCFQQFLDLQTISVSKCLIVTQCILLTRLAQIWERSFKLLQGISWRAVPAILEALNLGNGVPFLLMTKSTHLTIVDWGTICWHQIIEGSFIPLEGCSWPAVQTFSESSEPFEWLTMPSYNLIYSLDNWRLANKLNSNMEKIFQAYSRMQLMGYSSNLWALWTLETTTVFCVMSAQGALEIEKSIRHFTPQISAPYGHYISCFYLWQIH